MRRVALIGADDLGRTVAGHLAARNDLELAGFFDDTKTAETVCGKPVLGGLDRVAGMYAEDRFDGVVITIGYRHLAFRAELFSRLQQAGVSLERVVHPGCHLGTGVELGEGTILFPGCILDVRAQIGANSILYPGCNIAHDAIVGAHVIVSAGVLVAGFTRIEPMSFLGIGTVVSDHLTLGVGCQTGSGAVVVRDVPERTVVAGVPARATRRLE